MSRTAKLLPDLEEGCATPMTTNSLATATTASTASTT